MIWERSLLMTLNDVIIISIALASAWLLLRQKHKLLQVKAFFGSLLIMVGLSTIGLFYGMELLAMHVLPLYSTRQEALATMESLHLPDSWLVVLVSTLCGFAGFYWMTHKKNFLIDQLRLVQGNLEQELSEHRTTQNVLKKIEEQFRLFVEGAQDYSIFLLDPEGKILSWNAGAERINGYKGWEIVGQHFSCLYLPEEVATGNPDKELEIARALGRIEEQGWRVSKDGSRFWANVMIMALYDSKGQILEYLIITQDLTKQRHTEAALRESEEMTRQVLESIPDMVLVKNQGSRILWANKAFRDYYGMTNTQLQELIDAPFNDSNYTEQYLKDDARVFETGETCYISQEPVTRFDGEVRIFSTIKSPIFDKNGHVTKLVAVIRDITESKQAEEKIRKSEVRLNEAQRIASIGSWELDLVTNRLIWSDETYRIFEIDPTCFDASYNAFLETVHPEDRSSVNHAYTESVKKNTPYDTVHRLLFPDGRIKYVHERCQNCYDSEGNPLRSLGTVQDITPQKLAQDTLRYSDEKFRMMMDMVPDITFTTQPDGLCDFVNQRMHEYTGIPLGAALGFGWTRALHPDDLEKTTTSWMVSIRTGLPYEGQYRLKTPDGGYRWYIARAIPLKDTHGAILQWFGVLTDIDHLVRAKEAARKSEERLDLALAATNEGVWDWDLTTGQVVFSNRWIESLGYSRDKKNGDELEPYVDLLKRFIHPDDFSRMMEALTQHLDDLTPAYECEIQLMTKSGDWRWNLHSGKVVARDQNRKPLRMVGTNRDISDRKKVEQELQAAFEQLRQLTRKLGMAEEEERKRIARELHDEFGQTLAGLKFDLAQLRKLLTQEAPPAFSAACHSQLTSMASTVDNALHSVRKIATDLRPSLLDDLGLISALESLLQNFQAKTSIHCTLTVSPGVSSLEIDPERSLALFRITQELLTNVLKHARASHVAVTLTLEDDALALEFRDDGQGITKQELANTKSLGLLGIKERLSALDGQFAIQGDPGKGTQVAIQISLSSPAPIGIACGGL